MGSWAVWLDRGKWTGNRSLHSRPVLGGLENPLPQWAWSEELILFPGEEKQGPEGGGPVPDGVLWGPGQAATRSRTLRFLGGGAVLKPRVPVVGGSGKQERAGTDHLGSGACQGPGAACPTHQHPGPKHPNSHSELAHQIQASLTSHLSQPPALMEPVLDQGQE